MMTTRTQLLVGILTVLAVGSSVRAGELEKLYQKAQAERDDAPGGIKPEDEKHVITEIGLERMPCFGACPAYTVVIKSDGTLRYTGDRLTKRPGQHTGHVNPLQFSRLAKFIGEVGYANLKDSYVEPAKFFTPNTYTTVVTDGKRKVIASSVNLEPSSLWAIEELIDKLLLEARWDDEKPGEK